MLRSFRNMVVIGWIAGLCPAIALSQNRLIDSMENDLKHPKNDSFRFSLLSNLAMEYYEYDSVRAYRYLELGHALAIKAKYDYEMGSYYQNRGTLLELRSNYVKAGLYYDTAINYFQKAADARRNPTEIAQSKLSIATCKGQKGGILAQQGKSKEAISNYIAALEAWKASDDPRRYKAIGTYHSSIATVYFELKEYDKALQYDKSSIQYRLLDTTNEEGLGWSYIYVCDDFNFLKMPDSAMAYLQKAKPLILKVNKPLLNLQYYGKTAKIYQDKNDFHSAINYYSKSMSEAARMDNLFQVATTSNMIGYCYEKLQDYTSARKYLLKALDITSEGKFQRVELEILQELAIVEEKTKNMAEAYGYLKKADAIKDSLNASESRNAIAEIENKYQGAEKEKDILRLQKDKLIQALSLKQKATLNDILIGLVVVILLVASLGYRNLRQRQLVARQQDELQRRRIGELEKDRQLVAVDSLLKGQEEERSRLAKDLHDGLGGLLSGVKFSLSNMKDNLIITPDNMAVFERSLDMLDTSIKELRRVAHNMMPEMLSKFGLNEALKEYCSTINATKILTVKYQSLGMDSRLENSVEIIIFRIVQELLNNILKHAAAPEAFVQLIREDNRLNVVVEDYGKGFDTALTETSKGAGWVNIRSRVDYLKGQLDIHSEPGKGTLVNIEFNL
jgi:two-component system, NarL family, sensor kinase